MTSRAPAGTRLTNAQRLIWASQELHPDAPLYNMAFLFDIAGPVVHEDFRRAFSLLIGQCDALRTVVDTADGIPAQRVLDEYPYQLPFIDTSREPDAYAAAREWAQRRVETVLDPATELFDAALLKLDEDRYAWYFNQHHLVTDAWSSALIFERMEAIYSAVRDGAAAPADSMPPFADYVAAETAAPDASSGAAASAAPAPLYGPHPTAVGTANVRMVHAVTAEQQAGLDRLAARPEFRALTPDLTRFRIIATALFTYLHRVTGQTRLSIGAPAHNRATAEFRQTAGLFMELFPLGTEVDPADTFATLAAKVTRSSDAFMRAAQPGASRAEANRGMNVVLNVIRGAFDDFGGHAVTAEWLHPGHVDAEHHLRLQVHDFDGTGRPTLLFDCNDDVFGSELQAVPTHFLAVFDALLADPDAPIGTVDLLSTKERRRVLEVSDGPDAAPAPPIVDQFARWAERDPAAPALIEGSRTWSYGELADVAARVGGAIAPGSVVGVCMGRSAEAVAAMLGVLRAGAAYVPIDPDWPAGRIEFVLADAGCSLVIADRPGSFPVPTALFDELGTGPPAQPADVGPGDLAYILYTSGSTGQPKGVMVEHGSLSNYVTWASGCYDRGDRLAFPLFTPLTFDLTVTSLFVPLTSGGSIVVYPDAGGPADTAVLDVFADDRVDIVKLTPSHLALLPAGDFSAARIGQLILGGEDLTTAVAGRIHDRFGGTVQIHNEYGPTEATVGCVFHTFDPATDRAASVPIGRPIHNTTALVLDRGGHPVPFGVPGELHVGGIGVARGYLGRPDLTSDRFLPGGTLSAGPLYATGDLARIRPDGIIEYLGRSDDQVKIRGARVELGEVEAALAAHSRVTAAAARVWERRRDEAAEIVHCSRCGLASDYPGIEYDADRVCSQCRSFEGYRDRAALYFKPTPELEAILRNGSEESEYDCLALLSGGKDSTYVLCRLVDMGLRVLAFTLDNGYISDEAKGNIRRVVDTLGVDHIFATTAAMNEIFVDSLQRHGNVCQGCFKTIYTLSMQTARDKKIPYIVTGLSRGQFFETRLTEELFTQFDVTTEQIDADVLEARKAYHRVDDAVKQLLDVSMFEDDAIFDEVQFVDFYRYVDVGLEELYRYLGERVPWIRPRDTGRSTNCRINDVGIYFHRKTRGFHNYALPYSWDVRMGHKTREEALEELDDDIDVGAVSTMLAEIGYPEEVTEIETGTRLVGYYTGPEETPVAELRRHMSGLLPEQMVPSQFVRLDSIPLTANGKADREALPEPGSSRPLIDTVFLAPQSVTEVALAAVFEDVLGVEGIGVRDNFFDLGGDSIMAIQIVARAQRSGIGVTLHDLFETLTVEKLAAVAGRRAVPAAERVVGPVPLLPIQNWFFDTQPVVDHFHQVVRAHGPPDLDRALLAQHLEVVIDRHDALRQQFDLGDVGWGSEVVDRAGSPEVMEIVTAGDRSRLVRPFDLGRAPLLRAGIEHHDGDAIITLVAHHLVIDAVSWTTILDDLSSIHRAHLAGNPAPPPTITTSIRDWADALVARAATLDPARWLERDAGRRLADEHPASAPRVEVQHRLDASVTEALLDATDGSAGVEAVLVTALARTLAGEEGSVERRLMLEGHGRRSDDARLDPSRTVGWLTALYPVVVELPGGDDLAPAVDAVAARLAEAARVGRDYGVLRYLHLDPAVSEAVAVPAADHVLFNYLGTVPAGLDAPFRLAEPIELSRPAEAPAVFAAEVSGVIDRGELVITWVGRGDADAARANASRMAAVVEAFVGGSDAREAGAFPLAGLDDGGLDKLAAALRNAEQPPS